jgi:FkbM family methyltransferase
MPGKTAAKTVWFLAKRYPWFPMRSRMLEWVRAGGHAGLGGKTVRVKTRMGAIMEVDPLDEEGWVLFRDRGIRPQVAGVFRDLLHAGESAIDIGANYGYFTLLASSLAGAKGHVYAFEPNPTVANYLSANVGLNDVTNVRLYRVAVSNTKGTAEFHVVAGKSGASSLVRPEGEKTTAVKVSVAAIDSLASEMPHVRLVRIGAEGSELRILEGMKELLRYDHPYVTLEAGNRSARRTSGDATRVFELLHGFNYATYEIGASGTHPLSRPRDDRTCVLAAPPGSHVPGLGAGRR